MFWISRPERWHSGQSPGCICSWHGVNGNHCSGLLKSLSHNTPLAMVSSNSHNSRAFPLRCLSILGGLLLSSCIFTTFLRVFACLQQSHACQYWLSCQPHFCDTSTFFTWRMFIRCCRWKWFIRNTRQEERLAQWGTQAEGRVHPLQGDTKAHHGFVAKNT